MRFLVTGGSGHVGTHLVEHLTRSGHETIILDPARPPSFGTLSGCTWAADSVLDEAKVRQHVTRCDGVFHLAAVVGFARVMADPVRTILTNTQGTALVLKYASEAGVPVLLTSTSAVYGRSTNGGAPVTEDADAQLGPTTTTSWSYAYAKAADEALAFAYAAQYGLRVVVARLFNVVGSGQSADAGFVLPRFVQSALTDAPIDVHAPGTQTRTFVHVRDVARALAELLECPSARGQIVNVGGTATVSITQLAQQVIEATESRSEIRVLPAPYGPSYDNVSDRRPDLRRLEALLGWLPATPLHVMIADAIGSAQPVGT